MVSGLPEFVVGVLGPFIVLELALSATTFGMLTSTYFLVGSVLSLSAGSKVDSLGLHTTITAQLAFGLAGLVVLALSPTFWLMLMAMVLSGVSAAVATPVSNKVIALRVPRRAQGLALGINQSGIQIGTLLAGGLLPPLAGAFGWRAAIMVVMPVPILGLLLGRRIFGRDARQASPSGSDGETTAEPPPVRLVAWLAGFAFLMGSGISGTSAFLALFAFNVVGVPAHRAGTIIVALGVSGAISRIVWGHVAGRFARPWLLLPGFSLVAAVSTLLFAASAELGEAVTWLAALVFGLGAVAWSPVVHLSLVRLLSSGAVGRASGAVQGSFFVGMIVSPLLFGALVDRVSYVVAWYVLAAVFGAATVLALVWMARTRRVPPRP